jgi:hypothetical protein
MNNDILLKNTLNRQERRNEREKIIYGKILKF